MKQKFRRMTKGNITLKVTKHIIVKNFWEYYITTDTHNKDVVRALVMGTETELGDISLSEISPYIISSTTDLRSVAPAIGWRWVEEE